VSEPREVRRDAHAKLNMFLHVEALRDDGYHDLESLVVPLSLADEIVCREAAGLRLHVADGGPVVPAGPDNLAVVAALALAEIGAPAAGADIELIKRVPVAAGLGGGSADAAATLQALNDLWECGLSPEQLSEIGATVGSDVPALLAGGPVLVTGRGERVQPFKMPQLHWVLVPASFEIRTPEAFSWWDRHHPAASGDAPRLLDAARLGDAALIGPAMFNDLEAPVFAKHPEVRATKERILSAGATGVVMCGSGPTIAGLARSAEDASMLAQETGGIACSSFPG
jgi:4-diphosphocytidyl-2C-methyl-D-erythritol kinase